MFAKLTRLSERRSGATQVELEHDVVTEQKHSRLPNFIIVGAAKSGTTSLWHFLNHHSDVFMSNPKEPCYFDETVNWHRGLDWYKSLFSGAKDHQICGEASTNYTRWPQVKGVPEKIHSLLPNVKLIYVMRNPIDRAFSHYVHRWTKEVHVGQPFTMTFTEYCKTDPMCIDSSMYCNQLQQFRQFFPRQQILPLVFESMVAEPQIQINTILRFLGLRPSEACSEILPVVNQNERFRHYQIKNRVRDFLTNSRATKLLLNILPKEFKWVVYEELISKTSFVQSLKKAYEPIALTEQERVELQRLFYMPNLALAQEFGVDISHWQQKEN